MYDKKKIVIEYIKKRLADLKELNKKYSAEKIEKLADNLISTDKPLEELYALIDNKFSYQARKISHNNHLASLREYYLAQIDALKKGNNCYLLSYDQGAKILEQAYLEDQTVLNPNLTIVTINNKKVGYKKGNSLQSDYELIMSDIAYLLGIKYAKTYRIFSKDMEPIGILNEALASKKETFLNFEETLQFIKEESNKFTLKNELITYHDKLIKKGLQRAKTKKDYQDNIEYVLKLFAALPDITKTNVAELQKQYLNLKIFEIFTNSLNNKLTHYGIIIKKNDKTYTYTLAPTFNKSITKLPDLKDDETLCNFFIVSKKELLHTLITKYYQEVKELCTLISENRPTLLALIEQLTKEHLEFEEYKKYVSILTRNYKMLEDELSFKKSVSPDNEEDNRQYIINNNNYNYRISPYLDSYDYKAFDNTDDKGSIALTVAVVVVMIITLLIIAVAIYAISNVEI